MDNKALRCTPEEAQKTIAVMEEIKLLKQTYRLHRKGWTNDKQRTMRHRVRVPLWMIFHKEYGKYFDKSADQHEDKKNTELFLKRFPQFDLTK